MNSNIHIRVSLKKRVLRLLNTLLLRLIPTTPTGDHIYSFLLYLVIHKRYPSKINSTLNDILYFTKTTKEIINPLRVFVTDKEFVKLYVKAKIGDQYNVPTLAVLKNVEEALSFNYPENCVIKPTHTSGEKIFRRHGVDINFDLIKKWFRTNYYHEGREANYKNLLPKLIVEPFVFHNNSIVDYKIFCFNGKPCIIQVNLNINNARNIYTTDWELLPFTMSSSKGSGISKPKNLTEMLEISAVLSKDFPHIRIDLYSNGENIFVGELTNCHWNASVKFQPHSGEKEFWRIVSEKRCEL